MTKDEALAVIAQFPARLQAFRGQLDELQGAAETLGNDYAGAEYIQGALDQLDMRYLDENVSRCIAASGDLGAWEYLYWGDQRGRGATESEIEHQILDLYDPDLGVKRIQAYWRYRATLSDVPERRLDAIEELNR